MLLTTYGFGSVMTEGLQNAMTLNNVRFAYANSSTQHPTIDIKQWGVQDGESVFLQGKSGSGKSGVKP